MNAIIEQCKQALITAGYSSLATDLEIAWRNHRYQDKATQAAWRKKEQDAQKITSALSSALAAVYVLIDQLNHTTFARLAEVEKELKQTISEVYPSAPTATEESTNKVS